MAFLENLSSIDPNKLINKSNNISFNLNAEFIDKIINEINKKYNVYKLKIYNVDEKSQIIIIMHNRYNISRNKYLSSLSKILLIAILNLNNNSTGLFDYISCGAKADKKDRCILILKQYYSYLTNNFQIIRDSKYDFENLCVNKYYGFNPLEYNLKLLTEKNNTNNDNDNFSSILSTIDKYDAMIASINKKHIDYGISIIKLDKNKQLIIIKSKLYYKKWIRRRDIGRGANVRFSLLTDKLVALLKFNDNINNLTPIIPVTFDFIECHSILPVEQKCFEMLNEYYDLVISSLVEGIERTKDYNINIMVDKYDGFNLFKYNIKLLGWIQEEIKIINDQDDNKTEKNILQISPPEIDVKKEIKSKHDQDDIIIMLD